MKVEEKIQKIVDVLMDNEYNLTDGYEFYDKKRPVPEKLKQIAKEILDSIKPAKKK